jgi:hypothetical protein
MKPRLSALLLRFFFKVSSVWFSLSQEESRARRLGLKKDI